MPSSKQDQGKAKELAESLVPGTNVITRVKGYPVWPAVVVNDDDVPSQVKKAKPSKKVVVPVLFYNDNSFLWISPQECDLLSKEQATKNSNAKIKRTLKDAYAIAANPPSYEKLVAIATGQEQPSDANVLEEEIKVDEPEPVPEEPAPPAPPRSRRARPASERAKEQLPTRPAASGGRKRGRSDSPAISASAQTSNKKTKADNTDEEDDSEYVDNGTESTGDSGSTSAGVTGDTDASVSENLAQSQQARFELCSYVRQVLQVNLLTGKSKLDKSESSKVADVLGQLADAPEIEISVVRRAKLPRLVYSILQISTLPGDIREKLESWAQKWDTKAEPIVKGIPEELAPREETEEPEDFDASVDPSRETTEVPAEPELKSEVETTQEPTPLPEDTPQSDVSKNEEKVEEVNEKVEERPDEANIAEEEPEHASEKPEEEAKEETQNEELKEESKSEDKLEKTISA